MQLAHATNGRFDEKRSASGCCEWVDSMSCDVRRLKYLSKTTGVNIFG